MTVETAVIRDVVVVIPGIMGTELVSRDGRPLWTVAPGGLVSAIRGLARDALVLPQGIGDAAPDDGVRPTRLLESLHVIPGLWSPVTGYDGLLQFLRSARFHLVEPELGNDGVIPNLIQFPYDWRLSNRHNGRRLAEVALKALMRWREQPGMKDAKLVLICHSMGGLVARWFAEQEGGAEYIRALITIGTPHRGALKALTALVNGIDRRFGPLTLSVTALARSLPSLYQLLPQYDCLVVEDKSDSTRVSLSAKRIPGLDPTMLADANAFHAAIQPDGVRPYTLHKVVGIRQPTPTTARLVGDQIEAANDIDGYNQEGDGTVPRMAAEPLAGRGNEVHEVANEHGELQATRSLLDLVDGILTREQIIWQSPEVEPFGIEMADLWCAPEPPVLHITHMNDRRLRVTLQDESGRALRAPQPIPADGRLALDPLPQGGYRAIVEGRRGGTASVSKSFVVLTAT